MPQLDLRDHFEVGTEKQQGRKTDEEKKKTRNSSADEIQRT